MADSKFWKSFIQAAEAFREEDFREAARLLTRAVPWLTRGEHPEMIAAGVLKAKALLNSYSEHADDLELAGTCVKSAIGRLSSNYGPNHKGLIPLYRLASAIYGTIQTNYDMLAGICEADEECPERLDDIPDDIRPKEGDEERFREEISKRQAQKLVLTESAAGRMLEAMAERKAQAAERLEQIKRSKERG